MPRSDSLSKAIKQTERYKLQQLLAREMKWRRRLTIAQNKWNEARNDMHEFADELVEKLEAAGKPK